MVMKMNLRQIEFLLVNIVCLLISANNVVWSKSIVRRLPGFQGRLPSTLETGYVGVGEGENVELFYYFVESEREPEADPLMLWLSGGPGCSTLRAFFYEIGPFMFTGANSGESTIPTLDLNPYSWTKVANIIFLDQPVGTGFSYSKTWEASKTGDTLSSTQIYEFLQKWLMEHPEFLKNPLYICGTSYAGILTPNIVLQIYNGNEGGNQPTINIKGYMIGNPLTDKYGDLNSRVPYANRMTLVSDELYESAKANCHGNYIGDAANNKLCLQNLHYIDKCTDDIYLPQILEPMCPLMKTQKHMLKWDGTFIQENLIKLPQSPSLVTSSGCRSDAYVYSTIWANEKEVQKALHIREGTIKEWVRCNSTTFYNFGVNETPSYLFDVSSSVDYHYKLTGKKCRALIYSGDHDMVVPHIGTRKWIRGLNLSVKSTWEPWFVQTQVAGYVETYQKNKFSLTFATVKGAGHTGSEYKPRECVAMADRWFSHQHI